MLPQHVARVNGALDTARAVAARSPVRHKPATHPIGCKIARRYSGPALPCSELIVLRGWPVNLCQLGNIVTRLNSSRKWAYTAACTDIHLIQIFHSVSKFSTVDQQTTVSRYAKTQKVEVKIF